MAIVYKDCQGSEIILLNEQRLRLEQIDCRAVCMCTEENLAVAM